MKDTNTHNLAENTMTPAQKEKKPELEQKIVSRIRTIIENLDPNYLTTGGAMDHCKWMLFELIDTVESENVEIINWWVNKETITIKYNWIHECDLSLCCYDLEKSVRFGRLHH